MTAWAMLPQVQADAACLLISLNICCYDPLLLGLCFMHRCRQAISRQKADDGQTMGRE